jgi:hypothetical protein
LYALTDKNRPYVWTPQCEAAFCKLKSALVSPPILAYPVPSGHFYLETDASNVGIGAVLSQDQEGERRVIAYGSKMLSRSQRNYCTTMKELLAVVHFVKEFRYYLLGHKVTVITDHASLTWLQNFKAIEVDGLLARWLCQLGCCPDLKIVHRKGSLHSNADSLSRRPRRICLRPDCTDCQLVRTPKSKTLQAPDCASPPAAVPDVPPCQVVQEDILPDSSDEEDDFRALEAPSYQAVARITCALEDMEPVPDNIDSWCGGLTHDDLSLLQKEIVDLNFSCDLFRQHRE